LLPLESFEELLGRLDSLDVMRQLHFVCFWVLEHVTDVSQALDVVFRY